MRASAIVLAHGVEPTLRAMRGGARGRRSDGHPGRGQRGRRPARSRPLRSLPGVTGPGAGTQPGFRGRLQLRRESRHRRRPGVRQLGCRGPTGCTRCPVCVGSRTRASAWHRRTSGWPTTPTWLNSAGNPVHYLMFSWVGGFGEPAADHALLTEVASISGVTFAMRREVWDVAGRVRRRLRRLLRGRVPLAARLAGGLPRGPRAGGQSFSTTTTSPATRPSSTCSSATGS